MSHFPARETAATEADGPVGVSTRWLSMHADYACRDSGACCSSGWPIPVERERAPAIDRAATDGHLVVGSSWLQPVTHAPPDVAGVLRMTDGGRCVFHRSAVTADVQTAGGGCEIHHLLGHSALPSACQHFPRVCLVDPRGVFVTLSHYCPTAAAMLFEWTEPVEIVTGPPALAGATPQGLDAQSVLPPLLTPGVLMDHEGYGAWEAHMIRTLAGGESARAAPAPDHALDRLERDARVVATWRPGRRALADVIARLPLAAPPAGDVDWSRDRHLFDAARSSLVAPYEWPAAPCDSLDVWQSQVATAWPEYAEVIGRYLAAHAFASWMAYLGSGLQSVVRRLRMALALVRYESVRACQRDRAPLSRTQLEQAFRQSDRLLYHLADTDELARRMMIS